MDAVSEDTAPSPLPAAAPITDAAETKLRNLLHAAQPAQLASYIDRLRSAGVWADRSTSPNLLGQLFQCLKRPVDTIVCSTLDFDDALPLQQMVACQYALEIVAAVALLGAITGATRALIVIDKAADDDCRKAIERWTPKTGVRTLPLRNNYPQPHPTLLLHAVARRPLRPGTLPPESGALMLDAIAAAGVGRCLLYGEPLLHMPIGIADMREGDGKAYLLDAPIGMSVADLLREAGVPPGSFELRGGSPLREIRLRPSDCVISAGGEVALYLVTPQPILNPDPCIRCGWCTSGCPVHIHPAGILQAAQSQNTTAAEVFGLESCIECGICSYVCPSYLPLLGGVRALRKSSALSHSKT